MTLIIVIEFLVDPKVEHRAAQQVTYVELYPANRTDARDHRRPEEGRRRPAAAKKEKQRQFQKLENQLGM